MSSSVDECSNMKLSAKLLPGAGDEVVVAGLRSATEYNGRTGTVVSHDVRSGRYGVRLAGRDGDNPLGVKLANVSRVSSSSSGAAAEAVAGESRLHVLVPCHVGTQRRLVTFMRAAKSVSVQVLKEFSVFIGISGPEGHREKAANVVATLAYRHSGGGIRWYLQNCEMESRPQMEHLRHLHGDSLLVNPRALITFLDNDDMCHPQRFYQLLSAYRGANFPEGATLSIPCKLLLGDDISPEEGEFEKFVNVQDLTDFDQWKRFPELKRKVKFAPNSRVNEMDAEEYFDFIVPSDVMERFFHMTPVDVTKHRFCDLRLWAVLDYLNPMALADNPQVPWLLAHYKVSEDKKKRAFDNHGVLEVGRQSVDQVSFGQQELCHGDHALSQRFPVISPQQVAMCRAHVESLVVQFVAWNEETLEKVRQSKVGELNGLYGAGFGDALWAESVERIKSLFGPALEDNIDAWVEPLV